MNKLASIPVTLAGFLFVSSATVMAGKFDARIPMSVGKATTYPVSWSMEPKCRYLSIRWHNSASVPVCCRMLKRQYFQPPNVRYLG